MADFTPSIVTPNLQGYTGQEPFRFWCQMALPIVYDDTLSYYELLNKVVVYLNNTISDVAAAEENIQAINDATNTNIAALLQSYRQLQQYVNDYFTNLDVQQEINNKLDDMATSGELSNLLSPFIPDLVTNWLNVNVDPVGSAVVVDSSLSVSGAAADSKSVGDRFASMFEKFKTWTYDKTGNGAKPSYYLNSSLGVAADTIYKIHVSPTTLANGDEITITARSAGNLNAESLVATIATGINAECDIYFQMSTAEINNVVYFCANVNPSSTSNVYTLLDFYRGSVIDGDGNVYFQLVSMIENIENKIDNNSEKINELKTIQKNSSFSRGTVDTPAIVVYRAPMSWLNMVADTQYKLSFKNVSVTAPDVLRAAFQSTSSYSAADRVKLIVDRFSNDIDVYFSLTAAEVAAAQYLTIWTTAATTNAVCFQWDLYVGDVITALGELDELTKTNNLPSGVNEYYFDNNYLPDKITSIIQSKNFVNGVCFGFVTDMHAPANSLQSLPLLKYAAAKGGVNLILCGGDWSVATSTTPESTVKYSGSVAINYAAEIPNFYGVQGNHDFFTRVNWNDNTVGYTAQTPEIYNYLTRNAENRAIIDPPKGYFYIDNEPQKTRYFMLNSCEAHSNNQATGEGTYYLFTKAQADWLIEKMTEKSGWNYIFVSHIPCDPDLDGYSSTQDVLMEIMKSAKNKRNLTYTWNQGTISHDFTGFDNNVICWIGGHCHKDQSHIYDNVLSITTTCDAHYSDDNWNAVAGTITEQAVDVFCVDYDGGLINAVRIGRGQNRQWNIV